MEAADFTRTDLEFEKSAILETLDTLPTTFQMVGKFTMATYSWAKSGFKLADEAELKRRKSICNNCNFWYPTARMGLGKCLKCGCSSTKLKVKEKPFVIPKGFFSIHCFNLRLIWSEIILFCRILPNLEMIHTFVCWKSPCQPNQYSFFATATAYGSGAGACLVCECPMHKSPPDLPLPSKYTFA